MNVLEDVKVWGMVPREMAYLCLTPVALLTGMVTFLAFYLSFWWLLVGTASGVAASVLLWKLTLHLKHVAYLEYEESSPSPEA